MTVQYLIADVETYYDDLYTLRKMTPIEYALDPRFEAIGCAFKWGVDGESFWVDGADLQAFFDKLDASGIVLITHNALFDAVIFAWKFKFMPKMYVDTLGIARAMLGHELRSLALKSVATHLKLGVKGETVHNVKGMNRAAIRAAGLYDAYAAYSCNDADLCAAIFKTLVLDAGFPAEELYIQDMVLRCAIAPTLELDGTALAEHLQHTKNAKQALLDRLGMTQDEKGNLLSNDKFALLLRELGVDPPTKISLLTQKETFAFAKSDAAFTELLEHENPLVQAAVAARLGFKSTIEETRTARLLKIWGLPWGNGKHFLPVPLRYAGAHTHRLSGDWKLNLQNLPSRGGKNAIRRAIIAPSNHTIVAVDASQIEARIAAWFSGQYDLVEEFARGDDVYSSFATEVFGYPINKKEHPSERFVGKTGVLGLQYGVGWPKFQRTVELQSREFLGSPILLTNEESQHAVNVYRAKYMHLTNMRRQLNNTINVLASVNDETVIGPCRFERGRVVMPNGLALKYHNLTFTSDGWTYTYGGVVKRLYGGAFLENIIQALARIVVMQAAVRVRQAFARDPALAGLQLALQVHDELVYVVPDELVDEVRAIVMREMTREPSWGPGIPLAAEAATGRSFGECK